MRRFPFYKKEEAQKSLSLRAWIHQRGMPAEREILPPDGVQRLLVWVLNVQTLFRRNQEQSRRSSAVPQPEPNLLRGGAENMGIGGFHDVIIRPVVRRYIGEAAEPVRMGVHVIPVCAPAQYAVQNRCRLSPRDGLVRSESPIPIALNPALTGGPCHLGTEPVVRRHVGESRPIGDGLPGIPENGHYKLGPRDSPAGPEGSVAQSLHYPLGVHGPNGRLKSRTRCHVREGVPCRNIPVRQQIVENLSGLASGQAAPGAESPITETVEILLMVPLSLLRSRGKNGPDRVVAVNISECIGRHCAYAGFIHQYILNHIARLGTDGKALVCPLANGITAGANRDGYSALRTAQDLIAGRAAKSRAACILLLSSGRFNLNVQLGYDLAEEIQASVPIYAVKIPQTTSFFVGTPISDMSLKEAAMAAGETVSYSNVTITGGPGEGFTYAGGGKNITDSGSISCTDGVVTYRTGRFQMGQTLQLHFSAVLDDRSRTGSMEAAKAVVMQGEGLDPLTAGALSLERNSLTVTYDPNGADEGQPPVDSGRYAPGTTVTVKPASLKRDGWNFSGWTHPNASVRDGTFTITGNTELKAAWGRAYVKLSSSTFSSNVQGTHMLSRAEIENRYSADKAFYNPLYWDHLATVNLMTSVSVPADAEGQWDITDTVNFPDDQATAVMAWVGWLCLRIPGSFSSNVPLQRSTD